MDPLSHVSIGRTLVASVLPRARTDRRLRGCVAAAVLGTLAPDLDALFMPFGWDVYLRVHEIGTHSLPGNAACALLTAAVVRLFARNTSLAMLFASAWIGAISHLLLDLLSGARLRPGWPAIDTVVSLPIVAMADPWLLAICVAGPVSLWVWRDNPGRTGRIALGATLAFLLVKSVVGVAAFTAYQSARDASSQPVLARVIEARWASLNRWHVFDRTTERLRAWRTRAGGPAVEVFFWPIERETEPVRTSRSFSTVRNFLRVHHLGFAAVLPDGEGSSLVLWSDIRFCWDPTGPDAPMLEPIVRSEHGQRTIACALWFGGEIDADGLPVREIVKIGGFTQTRAIAR
jgi:inner membrane protein